MLLHVQMLQAFKSLLPNNILCRQLFSQQQQLAAQATQKKAAAAAKLSDGRGAPKLQVLRGSERLNKLSQTKAFKLAVVNKSTARSMYEVCDMRNPASMKIFKGPA